MIKMQDGKPQKKNPFVHCYVFLLDVPEMFIIFFAIIFDVLLFWIIEKSARYLHYKWLQRIN